MDSTTAPIANETSPCELFAPSVVHNAAAFHMKHDAYALARAARLRLPSLRVYAWAPPALSLGRSQRLDEALQQRCDRLGLTVIHRPSGGRAVLHGWDLTYAFCAPLPKHSTNYDAPPTRRAFGAPLESIYASLAQIFLSFLRDLGLTPQVYRPPRKARRSPGNTADANCFATPAAFEILVEGRKLLGNAQRIQGNAVLQHGSLACYRTPYPLLTQVFDAPERVFRAQMIDLQSLGIFETQAKLRDLLLEHFARQLNLHWIAPRQDLPRQDLVDEGLVAEGLVAEGN